MGYFNNLEIDVIEMYRQDGLREVEIAKITGLSLTEVQEILAAYDRRDDDADTDEVVSYDELQFDPNEVDYNSEHY